jgi:hypothetical protein
LLVFLAGLAAAHDPLAGPASFDEHGVQLFFHLQGGGISADDPPPGADPENVYIEEGGGGISLGVGYAFTPHFALQLALGTLLHDTSVEDLEVRHASMVVEAHYRFLAGERARPYVFGGLGGTSLEATVEEYESEANGGVAVLGAGVQVFMTRHLLLDMAGRLDLINWDRVRIRRERADGSTIELEEPIDEDGGAAQIRFGLLWQL